MKTKTYGSGGKRILLVAPKQPDNFWSLHGAIELFGKKTLMPNSALATLMALTPADVNVTYSLNDENVAPLDWNAPVDLVAVTGTTVHARRIREICLGFKKKGVPVALGGPYASVNADSCRDLSDYHFIGEAEYTWPRFLREWTAGKAQPLYHQAEQVKLADSPAPDWSLIDPEDYMALNVQTSRGCPHQCDFCDVIRFIGRQYRTKNIDQILTEVKNAHNVGARTVFFSDDNFIGKKSFSKELLRKILAWNTAQTRPLSFSTQITVNAADDEELIQLMAAARLSVVFIGVETVREDSLKEVGKTHNLKNNNVERLRTISRYGIVPFVGMVVGFDHDDAGVFDEIYNFLEETYSLVVSLSMLNAPKGTPLYERLQKEGRLVGDDMFGEWHAHTNIIPKQMSRDELIRRHSELFKKIYNPDSFDHRLKRWLNSVEYYSPLYTSKKTDYRQFLGFFNLIRYLIFKADPKVRSLFARNIVWTLRNHPKLMRRTMSILAHFRHYYEFAQKHSHDPDATLLQ